MQSSSAAGGDGKRKETKEERRVRLEKQSEAREVSVLYSREWSCRSWMCFFHCGVAAV